MDGWMSKIKDHTATKCPTPEGRPVQGAGADKQTVSHMEHTEVKLPRDQSRTTQHSQRREEMEVEGWRFKHGGLGRGGGTHRGCGQGRLTNQVGVRNGHAEAQPRARLLHGRDRRLEVAGERRRRGRRGGGRVGGLKQRGRKKGRKDRKESE